MHSKGEYIMENEKKFLLDLDLQYFASDDDNNNDDNQDDQNNDNTDNKDNKDNEDSKETFTKDDILKMIQSETDKVRTEYSKKVKAKEKELENLKREKMSEEEKKKFDEDLLRQENAELKKDKLGYIAIEHLAKNNLPIEANVFVVGEDEASTIEKIDIFKKFFNEAVTKQVNETFKKKGNDHKDGDNTQGGITKEQFQKMNYAQRTKLFSENPTLYKQLNQ
jgi:hypothetical protein